MAGSDENVILSNELNPGGQVGSHVDSEVIDSPLDIEDEEEVTQPANKENKTKDETDREVEGSAGPTDDEDYDDDVSGSGSGTDAPEVEEKTVKVSPVKQEAKDSVKEESEEEV